MIKTVQFKSAKYVGDSLNAIKIFNDKECDELIVLDISASKKGTKPDYDFISALASECFMPLGYGGGVRTIEDMKKLFSLGIEKVILNSAAINDVELISNAARIFGSQSIVVSIDVQKNIFGKYYLYSHSGLQVKQKEIFNHIDAVVEAGAGEIILNSVDRDGAMKGYDLSLIKKVSTYIDVPLVALGGAGSLRDLADAISVGALGAAAGSFFIFHGPHRGVLISYPNQSEIKNALKL